MQLSQIHEIKIKSRMITPENCRSYVEPRAYVFAPPEAKSAKKLPVLYVLAPWMSAGRELIQWKPFRESFPDRLLRLWKDKEIPECIAVFPDLFTEFGGAQYINSSYFGGHADFIVDELIPEVEKKFPVNQERFALGRSSGGFGALRLAMDFPGVFTGIACHSGDMGFEQMVRGDLTTLARGLDRYKGNISDFIKYCKSAEKLSPLDTHLLMLLGSCGFYSPNENSKLGYDLPIDLHTAELHKEVWEKWLEHDPVRRIDYARDHLAETKKIYVECGIKDQYNLLYGARQFHAKLKQYEIKHRYEEFDDNHSATDYR